MNKTQDFKELVIGAFHDREIFSTVECGEDSFLNAIVFKFDCGYGYIVRAYSFMEIKRIYDYKSFLFDLQRELFSLLIEDENIPLRIKQSCAERLKMIEAVNI